MITHYIGSQYTVEQTSSYLLPPFFLNLYKKFYNSEYVDKL